ncbi:MAG: multidrug transporter [Clostridia bacterium]
MIKVMKSLRNINYRLFFALLIMGLIPTIYTTVRIFFLGQMPGDWGFNIASQLSYVNLLYEIIQEALILPLFFFIGKTIGNTIEMTNRVRTGMLVTFLIYGMLSILILIFAKPLVKFMAQDIALIDETVTYIRLETIATLFSTLVKFITIVIVTLKKDIYLYFILGLQMFICILLDTFFVSNLSFSLKLGVNGIAYTNIIVNILMLFLAVFFLNKEKIFLFSKEKLNFNWMKEWTKISAYSGIESLVRNLAFMLMIVKMVNIVGEQGTFWVANNFIWGWLLLPIIQLGELIKRDCGENKSLIKENFLGYMVITTCVIILWLITIPLWQPFLKSVMNIDNYKNVFNLVLISLAFYVLFAFNNICDSIFYGIGETKYMLVQSLIINIVFYGLMYILYVAGIFVPTLTSIALMFAGGTALDSVLTYFMFAFFVKKGGLTDKEMLNSKNTIY